VRQRRRCDGRDRLRSGERLGPGRARWRPQRPRIRDLRWRRRGRPVRSDLGGFDASTHPFGLATTGGIVSTTGVGGLTLGGGIGYLARGLGLSCDNLVSADVVTADGRFLVASEHENEDLFWALCGGGNFGVVTSSQFRVHPFEEVYGGPMFFELDDAGDVLRFYREFITDAPEQFGGFPGFQIAPRLPFIPQDRHGDTLVLFLSCWSGPVEQGEENLKPLREVAPVVAEMVGPMPCPALNMAGDDQDRIKANYKGNFERLVDAKRKYDPGNLFHLNQNIKP
jgi:hypothetical protein